MSEKRDDGGLAFGGKRTDSFTWGDGRVTQEEEVHLGMSLRDYAAIKIAAALAVGCGGMLDREFSAYATGPCNAAIANRAYALADTLLRERAK